MHEDRGSETLSLPQCSAGELQRAARVLDYRTSSHVLLEEGPCEPLGLHAVQVVQIKCDSYDSHR